MEEKSSPPALTSETTKRKEELTWLARVKKGCILLKTSMEESFCYVKAWFVGLGKMATARNEREASEADMMTWKMQVEAADNAEQTKKRLDDKSM